MGHKRLGRLPKTKAWRLIVAELGSFALGKAEANDIAKKTLRQVQERYNNLENDPSIKAAFEFLVQVSYAFQKENPTKYLVENKILEKEELSVLKLARAIEGYKKEDVESQEYKTFARQAAIDAINNWYAAHLDEGLSLFNEKVDTRAVFRKASDGRGFCEISRLFFSKFTERYLKYFLDREASVSINTVNARNKFSSEIEKHVNDISLHAFQTAKITQSFAAGWYNKYAKENLPQEENIKSFLSTAFGKMKSELLEEEIN